MQIAVRTLQNLVAIALLIIAPTICAEPQPSYWSKTTAILDKIAELEGIDRTLLTSQLLLGTPYKLFPLGEGVSTEFANKPMYSLSAFDCLTFIETTLALSFSHTNEKVLTTLSDIRYHDQKHNFANRNHFMSTEWNYYNQKKGYITDITTKIYDKQYKPIYKTVQTTINKPAWLEFLAYHPAIIAKYTDNHDKYPAIKNTLLTYATQSRPKTATTAYIEVDSLTSSSGKIKTAIYKQLPKIFIIEIVRKNWGLANKIGTEIEISHVGFGIKSSQGLIFRHASETHGAVVDVPLAEYLTRQTKQKSFAGIIIEAINIK